MRLTDRHRRLALILAFAFSACAFALAWVTRDGLDLIAYGFIATWIAVLGTRRGG